MTANFEQRIGDAVCQIAHELKRLREEAEERRAWRRIEDKLDHLIAVVSKDPDLEAAIARVKASTERAIAHGKVADAESAKLSNPTKLGIDSPGAGALGAD